MALRLGVPLALLLSAPLSSAAQQTPAVETRMVEVDGLSLRVATAGLSEVGRPTVVFESGGATPLETWNPILAEVAALAPVVAYDRSGTGESPWDNEPPTPQRVTSRLKALLNVLGVPPPYVLVGHSWGGALVRYYAGFYPGDVAGLLYLDPTDPTQTRAEETAIFESIGAGVADYEAFYAMMESSLSAAPAPIRAEAEVILSLTRSELSSRDLRPPPDVPTSMILAGRVASLPAGVVSFDTNAYANAVFRSRTEHLRAWADAVSEGTFLIADAGHFIHAENPELVIDAIRSLVRVQSLGRN